MKQITFKNNQIHTLNDVVLGLYLWLKRQEYNTNKQRIDIKNFCNLLLPQATLIDEERNHLINKYGVKDEKTGQTSVDKDDTEKLNSFLKEINEFLMQDFKIDILPERENFITEAENYLKNYNNKISAEQGDMLDSWIESFNNKKEV